MTHLCFFRSGIMEVQESFILRISMIIVIYLSSSKAEFITEKVTRSWSTVNYKFRTLDMHQQKDIPLENTDNPLSQKELAKTKIPTSGIFKGNLARYQFQLTPSEQNV